jgi:membrane protease YdiL (CAAX protease family)
MGFTLAPLPLSIDYSAKKVKEISIQKDAGKLHLTFYESLCIIPHMKIRPFLSAPFWGVILLVLFNNLIDFLPFGLHDTFYLWLNLLLLLIAWWWTRKFLHLSAEDIGFRRKNLARSLLLGFAVAFALIAPFAIILWIRGFIGLNLKGPVLAVDSLQDLLFRSLVRIPFGTALFEEMLFRGFAYGYVQKRFNSLKAILISSFLFSCWHIVPAFRTVRGNFRVGDVFLGASLWIIFMVGSFIAGLMFAWLRYKGKHIGGCILAHALINSLALVLMYVAWHS